MRTNSHSILFFLIFTTREAYGKLYYGSSPDYFGSSSSSSVEYIMPAPPPLPPPNQQDKDDTAKIVESQFDECTIATILPFRDLVHRKVINEQITTPNKGKRLIESNFLPNHEKNPPFKDLCFVLLNDPIKVLAMYLGEFLHRKDETMIIIVLTLCQKMRDLKYIYDQNHKNGLTKRRRKQRHPFANLMKAWVEEVGDREPEDSCDFTPENVNKQVENLKAEYPEWDDHRDTIEYVLIKKCRTFAAAVLKKFEEDLKITMEKAVQDKIKNHDLVDAYLSLVLYVKDRDMYMARILLDYSNGSDRWAVWLMMVGFIAGEDWPKIDQAFRKISGNISLVEYIVRNPDPDKFLLGSMAVIIDPKYKPTYL